MMLDDASHGQMRVSAATPACLLIQDPDEMAVYIDHLEGFIRHHHEGDGLANFLLAKRPQRSSKQMCAACLGTGTRRDA
jgi:hypothetical protein